MDVELVPRSLVLVEYPSVVRNQARMLDSLGGPAQVAGIIADPQFRLPLFLDPDQGFSKPVFGDRRRRPAEPSLLLRVKVRRRKGGDASDAHVASAQVVGITQTAFTFANLADFQYVPIGRNRAGAKVDIQRSLLQFDPDDPIQPLDQLLANDLPLMPAPVVFSRFDRPIPYYFKSEVSADSGNNTGAKEPTVSMDGAAASQQSTAEQPTPEQSSAQPEDPAIFVSHSTRKRRLNGTQYMRFTDQRVPDTICEAISDVIPRGRMQMADDRLKELFSQQPCWLTKALCYEMRDHPGLQRILLKGCVQRHAFLCYTGPWSRQWVRLGYDPRAHPDARWMQTFDYRLPKRFAQHNLQLRDEGGAVGTGSGESKRKMKAVHSSTVADMDKQNTVTEFEFKIFADELPTAFNIFCQLRHIQIDRVQTLLEKTECAADCSEADGWFPPGTVDRVRAMVEQQHKQLPRYKQLDARCTHNFKEKVIKDS